MVRILGDKDREASLALLDRDHELNLIMIHNIQQFGLENQGGFFQGEYYGVHKDGELGGIAALYNFGSMLIYTPQDDLGRELSSHLISLEVRPRYLAGRDDWVRELMGKMQHQGLRARGVELQDFMLLRRESFKPRDAATARFAEPRDLEAIIGLHRDFQLEYFGSLDEAEEELARQAENRMVDYGISVAEEDGRIVAKAEIMARTSKAALIGGVYTAPPYRARGFSLAVMSLLCEEILRRREKACLTVSKQNPPAQRIYRSLGFEKLYDYRMANFF